MSIPSDFPRWASANPSGIVAPTSGKLDVGFNTPNEQPAKEHLNWLFNLIYLWVVYLAGVASRSTTVVLGAIGLFAGAPASGADLGGQSMEPGVATFFGTVQIPVGATITAVRANIHIDSGHTSASEMTLYARRAHTDGTAYDFMNGVSDNATSASGAGFKAITYTCSTNNVMPAGKYLQVGIAAAHASHLCFSVEVDYTPAA